MKLHRWRYWLNNQRPENPELFDQEVKTVCNLYAAAPELHQQGVHVMSTDEKTGIQALERAHPNKPMKPGKPTYIEHEYIRHGTQVLIANLEVATGQCAAPTVSETRKETDFAAHIEQTIAADPEGIWIFIVDQLNTHKSESLVHIKMLFAFCIMTSPLFVNPLCRAPFDSWNINTHLSSMRVS